MSLALLLSLALAADPIDPATSAAIEHQQRKARADVDKKFGNRTAAQMNPDERRDYQQALAEAEQKVLDQNGVTAKDVDRADRRQGREASAERKATLKALEEQDAAEAARAKEKQQQDVVVQKGISDTAPVTLEDQQNADGVSVERSLPSDAQADVAAASGGAVPAADEPAQKPAALKPSAPEPKAKAHGGKSGGKAGGRGKR